MSLHNRRKVVYDEARRQSDGSDSCWSCSDSDTGSVAELEACNEPPALEGAGVVAVGEGELVGEGQDPLQPDGRVPAVLGKMMQRVESSLHPRGLAPKRLRNETMGSNDQC